VKHNTYFSPGGALGETVGTTRPDGLGQLLVEARAEDGQIRAAVAAADEDVQRRHRVPTAGREHGQVPVATRQRSAGHGLAPGVRRQPEGTGPTFAAERVPRVARQGQEVPATGVPVRGTHTVQQGEEIPRPNGKWCSGVVSCARGGGHAVPRGTWPAGAVVVIAVGPLIILCVVPS